MHFFRTLPPAARCDLGSSKNSYSGHIFLVLFESASGPHYLIKNRNRTLTTMSTTCVVVLPNERVTWRFDSGPRTGNGTRSERAQYPIHSTCDAACRHGESNIPDDVPATSRSRVCQRRRAAHAVVVKPTAKISVGVACATDRP